LAITPSTNITVSVDWKNASAPTPLSIKTPVARRSPTWLPMSGISANPTVVTVYMAKYTHCQNG